VCIRAGPMLVPELTSASGRASMEKLPGSSVRIDSVLRTVLSNHQPAVRKALRTITDDPTAADRTPETTVVR